MNREVGKAMLGSLGTMVLHPNIRIECLEFYRGAWVHLSELRLDMFLQQGLNDEMLS